MDENICGQVKLVDNILQAEDFSYQTDAKILKQIDFFMK